MQISLRAFYTATDPKHGFSFFKEIRHYVETLYYHPQNLWSFQIAPNIMYNIIKVKRDLCHYIDGSDNNITKFKWHFPEARKIK